MSAEVFERLQDAGVIASELWDGVDEDTESFYEVQHPHYLLHTHNFSGEVTVLSGVLPSGRVVTDYNAFDPQEIKWGNVELLLNVQRSSDLTEIIVYILDTEFDHYVEYIAELGYEFDGCPDINSPEFLRSIEDPEISHIYKTAFRMKLLMESL